MVHLSWSRLGRCWQFGGFNNEPEERPTGALGATNQMGCLRRALPLWLNEKRRLACALGLASDELEDVDPLFWGSNCLGAEREKSGEDKPRIS